MYGSTLLSAGDTLSSAFENTSYKSQLRYYTFQRSYDELLEDSAGDFTIQNDYKKLSNAIGGYFGFETGSFYHLSIGSTFYTSQPVFHNPLSESGLQLLKDDQNGYSVLGEAFVKWKYGQTILKIGRQLLSDYQFLSDNDIRMTPYSYEAAIFENRDYKNITLRAAAVSGVKTLVSTKYIDFVNASKDILREKTIERNPIRGDYNPAYYDGNGNYTGPKKNLYLLSAVYNDKQSDLEFWNYYVADFVNFLYITGSYGFQTGSFSNTLGIQFIKQDDVGEHVAGSIDTYTYGAKFTSVYDPFTFTYAFNKTKYDENSLDGGTVIDMWGANQIYCSLMYNGGDQGGTVSNVISIEYDFLSYDLSILLNAGKFDLPNKLTDLFADQDNHEYNLIIKYIPTWNKHLQFKIETAYINFDTDYDFRAYEDLHGFNFLHAYDDITDLRFIVNYTF
ncbi:OprD family outer membrane porin [Sulfurovum sp.]|uniref:OprD family outer membrane porin n=1 Tax=Sulfurovum sp. TaxID=1969726 RepID=UPI0025D66313|nr:OprD family outer membrane porin [Sulfurovum sp.]